MSECKFKFFKNLKVNLLIITIVSKRGLSGCLFSFILFYIFQILNKQVFQFYFCVSVCVFGYVGVCVCVSLCICVCV